MMSQSIIIIKAKAFPNTSVPFVDNRIRFIDKIVEAIYIKILTYIKAIHVNLYTHLPYIFS